MKRHVARVRTQILREKKKGECPQGSDEAYEEEHETAEVGEPT